jgi:hypothetical protein
MRAFRSLTSLAKHPVAAALQVDPLQQKTAETVNFVNFRGKIGILTPEKPGDSA